MLGTRNASLRHRRKKIGGFSLTELALVFGITSVVLGAIWVVWGQVDTSNKMRITVQQLTAIAHNIRAIFADQGGVTDTGANKLIQALDQLKAFPVEMRKDQSAPAGVIFHPWSFQTFFGGGNVWVDAYKCTGAIQETGTPQPCFGVTFLDLPQNACLQLMAQTSQTGSGLELIEINGVAAGQINNAALPLPIPDATALADCNNSGTTGVSNDILWIYSVRGDN